MASYLDYPGQVSSRAAAKRPSILGNTKLNPGFQQKEEPFHGKQGLGDQAGADWNKPYDGGDTSVASARHIDQKQTKGSPAKASGKPSKAGAKGDAGGKYKLKKLKGTRDTGGANVGAEVQPTRKAHIDNTKIQKPDFPKAAGRFKTGGSDGAYTTGYARKPANNLSGWKDKSGLKNK